MSSGPRKADGFDGTTQDHDVKILMYCNVVTNVAKGKTVMVSTDTTYGLGNSVIAATQAGGAAIVGIADSTPAAAGDLLVQVSGIRTDVVCDDTVVAFERLTVGSTAGQLFDIRDAVGVNTSQADFNHALNVAQRQLISHLGGGVAIALTDEPGSGVVNQCTARLLAPMHLAH